MKYITFAVPCYNSEDYLERCVDSLLPGGEDAEIILTGYRLARKYYKFQ